LLGLGVLVGLYVYDIKRGVNTNAQAIDVIRLPGIFTGDVPEEFGVIRRIYFAPGCEDNAYGLTCFNRRIYVHFNNQGDYYRGSAPSGYYYNVYAFDPETGKFEKVLERFMDSR
jgi:hypothetical protein